jgi:hypothetical protein
MKSNVGVERSSWRTIDYVYGKRTFMFALAIAFAVGPLLAQLQPIAL